MTFRGNDILFRGNEIVIRGNEIVIRGNEIVIRGNEIVFCGNEIIFCEKQIVFRENKIVFRENKIVFCGNEILFCGNEIVFCGNELLFCGELNNNLWERNNNLWEQNNFETGKYLPFMGSVSRWYQRELKLINDRTGLQPLNALIGYPCIQSVMGHRVEDLRKLLPSLHALFLFLHYHKIYMPTVCTYIKYREANRTVSPPAQEKDHCDRCSIVQGLYAWSNNSLPIANDTIRPIV